MSISDQIVVMKDGVLQQLGRPQKVYDDPVNLFVARFLGNPPINVFHGRVAGGKLWLGEDAVLSVKDVPDQDVWCAIRPEGFILDDNGPMRCEKRGVEIMGRDVSVVAGHPALEGIQLRAITAAARRLEEDAQSVRFRVDPEKALIFRKGDETRIPCDMA